MRFSKSTGCFYPSDVAYAGLPDDLIEVGNEQQQAAITRKKGESLDVVDGKLVIVPAPTPDPIAVLVASKANALDRINAFTKSKRALIAGTSDDAEIAGWGNKLRIAQAIIAGTATDGEKAVFQAEITARGIKGETLDIFTQKVIKNAGFFAHAVGLIDGLKRKAHDAILAAKTTDEVGNILEDMEAQAEEEFDKLMQSSPE